MKASEPLAKEMAEIFRETVEEKLATRNDILTIQKDLKETENRLQKDIRETEVRLQKELEKMKIELKAKIETDIAKSKSETIKWIIGWVTGLLVAQTGFLAGFLK